MEKVIENYDKVSIVERRISYLLGAKLRNKDKMKMAMENRIRLGRTILLFRDGTVSLQLGNGERLDECFRRVRNFKMVCK